jgi:ribosomal protein S25
MGGSKKKNISQMNKAQSVQEKEQVKKSKTKNIADTKQKGIDMPDINDKKIVSELSKLKVLTPYEISSQFNLKISVAKDLLKELERKKIIKPVEGNARIRIYQLVAS